MISFCHHCNFPLRLLSSPENVSSPPPLLGSSIKKVNCWDPFSINVTHLHSLPPLLCPLPLLYVTPHSWNTYFDIYSDFRSYLLFSPSICFCFTFIYTIILYWIQIRALGVSPSLNRGPDPSVLLYDNCVLMLLLLEFILQLCFCALILTYTDA